MDTDIVYKKGKKSKKTEWQSNPTLFIAGGWE
jgi:hypothetical protein